MSPPRSPRGWVTFQGIQWGRAQGPHVSVLMGDDPPTIVDGYAKYETIDRPLARGVTVFQGYDPTQMTISLRFGRWDKGRGWDRSETAGRGVEADIETMGWMAGELYSVGPSPIVYVECYGPFGRSQLIPYRFQGSRVAWIVSGLTWSNVAWKNIHGQRIWQEASVTLMQFLGAPGYQTPPRETISQRGGWLVADQIGVNAVKIVNQSRNLGLSMSERDAIARQIVTDPRNVHIYGTRGSIRQPIKPGTRVWVPARLV